MKDTIEFLKNRLEVIKKRVVASNDYKEMKVLERMIEELEAPISHQEQAIPQMPSATKFKRTSGYSKDMNNSPAKEMPHGRRISGIYGIVEKIVRENGGEMEIPLIVEFLKEDYGMKWKDVDKNGEEKSSSSRISTYINKYNERHIDDQILQLLPAAPLGKSRPRKYTKVVLINKQRKAS